MEEIQQTRQTGSGRPVFVDIVRAPFFWQMLTLLALAVSTRVWMAAQSDPGSTIRGWGVFAPVVSMLMHAATAMTPVGSSVIPILNGMLFTFAVAVCLNVVGAVLGSVCLYYTWRRGQHDFQIRERLQSLPPCVRRFARADVRSLIVMRYVPWVGCNLANMIAGSHRVSLMTHILSTIIGALPGAFIYASVGAGIVAL